MTAPVGSFTVPLMDPFTFCPHPEATNNAESIEMQIAYFRHSLAIAFASSFCFPNSHRLTKIAVYRGMQPASRHVRYFKFDHRPFCRLHASVDCYFCQAMGDWEAK